MRDANDNDPRTITLSSTTIGLLAAGENMRAVLYDRAMRLDKEPGNQTRVAANLWFVEEWDKAVAVLKEELK